MTANHALSVTRSKEIDLILRQKVSRTKDACHKAQSGFALIVADMPLPPPDYDSSARIKDAAIAESVALDSFGRALEELNSFVQGGVIPGWLK
jgi:hypothetical protein